ncbi:MAG TPA: hypothetical protein P5210_00655, partial [Draconibacterium sp.]|nr:hypothetical protein [Draconibacterium sp.]
MNNNIWLRSILILILTLLISSATFAEIGDTSAIDSLYKIINHKTGADKIKAQLDLALKIVIKDKDEAMIMANSALAEAKTTGDKNLLLHSYYMLGRMYMETANNGLSLVYLDSALVIAKSVDDIWNKSEILYQIGVNKHRMGEALEALVSFNASIQASRLSGNFKTAGS